MIELILATLTVAILSAGAVACAGELVLTPEYDTSTRCGELEWRHRLASDLRENHISRATQAQGSYNSELANIQWSAADEFTALRNKHFDDAIALQCEWSAHAMPPPTLTPPPAPAFTIAASELASNIDLARTHSGEWVRVTGVKAALLSSNRQKLTYSIDRSYQQRVEFRLDQPWAYHTDAADLDCRFSGTNTGTIDGPTAEWREYAIMKHCRPATAMPSSPASSR